jgi:hypothetical protein
VIRDPFEDPYEQRILHYLKFAAGKAFSAEFLANVDFQYIRPYLDQIVAGMHAHVLVDNLLTDKQQVPFSGTVRRADIPDSVLVELPRTWWQRLLRRPGRRVWRTVLGHATYGDEVAKIRLQGAALVKAEYFAAFPEAPRYTANFGPVVALVQTSTPEITDWHPTLGDTA